MMTFRIQFRSFSITQKGKIKRRSDMGCGGVPRGWGSLTSYTERLFLYSDWIKCHDEFLFV